MIDLNIMSPIMTISETALINERYVYDSYHGIISTVFQGGQYAYMVSARLRNTARLKSCRMHTGNWLCATSPRTSHPITR